MPEWAVRRARAPGGAGCPCGRNRWCRRSARRSCRRRSWGGSTHRPWRRGSRPPRRRRTRRAACPPAAAVLRQPAHGLQHRRHRSLGVAGAAAVEPAAALAQHERIAGPPGAGGHHVDVRVEGEGRARAVVEHTDDVGAAGHDVGGVGSKPHAGHGGLQPLRRLQLAARAGFAYRRRPAAPGRRSSAAGRAPRCRSCQPRSDRPIGRPSYNHARHAQGGRRSPRRAACPAIGQLLPIRCYCLGWTI